jgi:hypothetical protein
MVFTYVAGFLFNIVLCFVMGNPSEILASPVAQPVAQIFYNVLGKAGGIFYTVCALIISKYITRSCFSRVQDVQQLMHLQLNLSASPLWYVGFLWFLHSPFLFQFWGCWSFPSKKCCLNDQRAVRHPPEACRETQVFLTGCVHVVVLLSIKPPFYLMDPDCFESKLKDLS